MIPILKMHEHLAQNADGVNNQCSKPSGHKGVGKLFFAVFTAG